jgi:SAM-dependent methyltransferase
MLHREVKDLYYKLLAVPMRANAWLYRRWRAPRSGQLKVHLGPGQKNYLPGWINVDANFLTAKTDVWADLRNALPFRDGTVDVFYSHHVIEHLPDALLPFHFAEMHRCLRPGGCIRVGGPNADMAVRKFVEGDSGWFSDFPDRRASLGGRFANFLLCRGEHLTILTESYLTEIATGAGFQGLTRCAPKTETRHPHWIDEAVLGLEWESTPSTPHTLLLEADKPASHP